MNAVVKPIQSASALPKAWPRIVVVDDSPASLALYRRSAMGMELDITLFESPREGFAYLENHPVDLLFLGNLMRETDERPKLRIMENGTAVRCHCTPTAASS